VSWCLSALGEGDAKCIMTPEPTPDDQTRQPPARDPFRNACMCVCVRTRRHRSTQFPSHRKTLSQWCREDKKKRILLAPRIHIYASPSIPHSSSGMNNLGGETRIYGSEIQTRSSLRFQKRQNLITIVAQHGHRTVWIFILHRHENQDYKYYRLDFSKIIWTII